MSYTNVSSALLAAAAPASCGTVVQHAGSAPSASKLGAGPHLRYSKQRSTAAQSSAASPICAASSLHTLITTCNPA